MPALLLGSADSKVATVEALAARAAAVISMDDDVDYVLETLMLIA